jgi:flagellar protein FlaG
VATISATSDATFGTQARPLSVDPVVTKQPQNPAQDEADLRLVIEEGQAPGSYIYKTINRVTGEIVAQYPREALLRLRDDADYAVGAVVSAKA